MSTSSSPIITSDLEEGAQAPRKAKVAVGGLSRFVVGNAGLLLVVLSQVFFSMTDAAVKKLSVVDPSMSTLELILVRMGITYFCSLVYMLAVRDSRGGSYTRTERRTIASSIQGFVALFGIYFSLQYLSLSDAIVLTFLAPLCTAIAGALFLKERFGPLQGLAGGVSLVGVVLIARPPFLFSVNDGLTGPAGARASVNPVGNAESPERVMAVGIALVGVLGMAGAYVSIRAIGKRAHPTQVTSSFSLYSVVASTIGMIVTKTPLIIPTRLDWLILFILIGIFGFTGQIFLAMGLQREVAWRASTALYTQIVFATIFQLVFFHSTPSWLSILGMGFILSSALYVMLTKEPVEPESAGEGPVMSDGDYYRLEATLCAPPENPDEAAEFSR